MYYPRLLVGTLLSLQATLVFSQTPAAPSTASPPAPAAAVPTDPTVPDSTLQQFLGTGNKAGAPQLPSLVIRGKLLVAGRSGVLVFELDKQLYMLNEGATLNLTGPYSSISLRLVELSRDSVVLEAQPLNKTIRLQ